MDNEQQIITPTPEIKSKKKLIITIIGLIIIILIGLGIYLFFTKPDSQPTVVTPEPNIAAVNSLEDSPFGFHPGNANNYSYALDMGSFWSRQGTYVIWTWVDPNKNGSFKFINAVSPPKPDVPGSGGKIDYDELRSNPLESINVVANVCPFSSRGEKEFVNEQEKKIYSNFIKKNVERYDGDSDLGCTQTVPDCYIKGDNEYPNQETINKLKANPVKYWQVCNDFFDVCGGKEQCRNNLYAKKYAEVQRITYQAVKLADPSASVLIAGDTASEYYPAVLKELGGKYVDIIDRHIFGNDLNYSPKETFDYIKTSLQAAGFDLSKLRFWITETGTYSGDPLPSPKGVDEPYQSEKQQANSLVKRYVSDLSYGIEKIFWAWNIMESFRRDCTFFDYTGLIYDGCDCSNGKYVCQKNIGYDLGKDVKKLAYYSYKLMTEKLEGSDWDNISKVQEANEIYIYKFNKAGKNIWVAWNDNSGTQQVTISGVSSTKVKVTEAVPKYASGKEVIDYSSAFNTEIKTVSSGGQVTITLGQNPVYIELD